MSSSFIDASPKPTIPRSWKHPGRIRRQSDPSHICIATVAYHGAPVHLWRQYDAARRHLSRIIVAGCEEPEVAARLGWESAHTLDEAIALATAEIGRAATITYLHAPPMVIADVE